MNIALKSLSDNAYRVALVITLLILGLVSASRPTTAAASPLQEEITSLALSQPLFASSNATAVVATGALNVRSGPGIGYNVIATAYQGHVVALIGRNSTSTWANVRLYTGREGWVNAALVHPNVAISSLPVTDSHVPAPAATAVVATGALNVRSGPSIAYNILTTLTHGQSVALIGRNANSTWAQVRLASGLQGWVNAALIQPNVAISSLPVAGASTAPPTATATVATGALNVRSGPGVNYTIVAALSYGQSVGLIGRNAANTWVQVRLASGQQGWVNASLIQPNVVITTLPVVGVGAVSPTAVVTTSALNVRAGPTVGYTVVGWLNQGQSVTLLGRNSNSNWLQVRLASGHIGWVNAAFVQPNTAVGNLPVTW